MTTIKEKLEELKQGPIFINERKMSTGHRMGLLNVFTRVNGQDIDPYSETEITNEQLVEEAIEYLMTKYLDHDQSSIESFMSIYNDDQTKTEPQAPALED